MKPQSLWGTALRIGALSKRSGPYSVNPTDTLSEQNLAGSGYLDNHEIDPVTLPSFVQTWAFDLPITQLGPEQFHAKPLVYAPGRGRRQNVYLFSEQNAVYILDASNGSVIHDRRFLEGDELPFLSESLNGTCPTSFWGSVGITGTPVIDPVSETIFFWAKGYRVNGVSGEIEAIYRFHAVDATTLSERNGFPVTIDYHVAHNDNTRLFSSNPLVQRSPLKLIDNVVYAAFAADCDDSSDNGWLVGMRADTGEPVAIMSTTSGIWNSGASVIFDGERHLYVAGRQNLAIFHIGEEGNLTEASTWNPYSGQGLFNGHVEPGSFSLSLLPFASPRVRRIVLAADKNGKFVSFNADLMGTPEAVIQTFGAPTGASSPSGIAVYPLEGGYVYYTAPDGRTYAYHFGTDQDFNPLFSLDGSSLEAAYGLASTVITSKDGKDGSGVLWVADDSGVRAYRAIPENGQLKKIELPPAPPPARLQVPVFGNNAYFVMTTKGLAAFGSNPDVPIICDGPLDFGILNVGEYRVANASCFANRQIDSIDALEVSNKYFTADFDSLPKGPVDCGQSFSFPVTFQLPSLDPKQAATTSDRIRQSLGWNTTDFRWNTTAGMNRLEDPDLTPGLHTGSIGICASEGLISGLGVSAQARTSVPFVSITPSNITFMPFTVLTGSDSLHSSFRIENRGDQMMEIYGFSYTNNLSGDWFNATKDVSDGKWMLDDEGAFKASNLPIGGLVPGGDGAIVVDVEFLANIPGEYLSVLAVDTSGGIGYIILVGSAATAPWAVVEVSEDEIEFTRIEDCYSQAPCGFTIGLGESTGPGFTVPYTNLRVSNPGTSDLSVVHSSWGGDLDAIAPIVGSLHLNSTIGFTNYTEEVVVFMPTTTLPMYYTAMYTATWAIQLGDSGWGKHTLEFVGTLVGSTPTPTQGVWENSTVPSEVDTSTGYYNGNAPTSAPTSAPDWTFGDDRWARMFV